jgi:hypothetical protein
MKDSLNSLKAIFPKLNLPTINTPQALKVQKEVFIVTNGDLRLEANQTCWKVQKTFEDKLFHVLESRFEIKPIRAHKYKENEKHGFISSQKEGSEIFANIESNSPVIVLLTSWQYSHHIAPSLAKHNGPVLILANFDGTWPGLVGALNLEGSLTSLGKEYSRLWSENFDDPFFYAKLEEWFTSGAIHHDLNYLTSVPSNSFLFHSEYGKLGKYLGEYILQKKEIMGLFDSFCMGMINGVFPQKALCKIGMPLESLSQSMLVHEMSKVSQAEREECLQFYKKKGMTFKFGDNPAKELTKEQVLEQCAMLIAMARVTEEFGLTCVGVQYQQGLKDVCAASDFAEGAIGSTDRFPIKGKHNSIIREGEPIPHINEVDMGSAIPQIMLFRLLKSLGLPCETTLHDIRWGSEYKGTFYWDFEISGNVPFEHIKGGIKGATGHRQPAMYFSKGGSTISGQCKSGDFVWARAHYEDTDVHIHIGTGSAYELPEAEYQRRLNATTSVWPLMNVVLDGIDRDSLMAGHQSNHITIAYVPNGSQQDLATALVCMGVTLGMKVKLAGIKPNPSKVN